MPHEPCLWHSVTGALHPSRPPPRGCGNLPFLPAGRDLPRSLLQGRWSAELHIKGKVGEHVSEPPHGPEGAAVALHAVLAEQAGVTPGGASVHLRRLLPELSHWWPQWGLGLLQWVRHTSTGFLCPAPLTRPTRPGLQQEPRGSGQAAGAVSASSLGSVRSKQNFRCDQHLS